MDDFEKAFAAVFGAIIGVAIVAVLVSQNSNTANVITAGGSALTGLLRVAVSPVTGGTQYLAAPASGPGTTSTASGVGGLLSGLGGGVGGLTGLVTGSASGSSSSNPFGGAGINLGAASTPVTDVFGGAGVSLGQ